jgi:hypothetical protein
MRDRLLESAKRLHGYLLTNHWKDKALQGPTPGVRWNLRYWRFVRAYLGFLPWGDDSVSFQGQGYWIMANWILHRLTKEDIYGKTALASTETVLEAQRPNGSWPNAYRERKDLISTIEGMWASLGLLATFSRTGDQRCLDGAIAWHRCMTDRIGFQTHGTSGAAINYFDIPRGKVPNNSTAALYFLSELSQSTGEKNYIEPAASLLNFLADVQTSHGEMPYEIPGDAHRRSVPHYQCYQYNSFQLADLYLYWRNTGSDEARAIAKGIASFVTGALTDAGACKCRCGARLPHLVYHAGVLAYSLSCATRWGIGDFDEQAKRAFAWMLDRQRPDGSFPFSLGDYWILSDGRSYPGNLVMILYHMVSEVSSDS